ncbi:MAG: Lrp/AsnC family transcriptional regulator [Desulfobacterales bacterium]
MLSETEKKVIAALGGDIPVAERPFLELARETGLSEEVFLETLRGLIARGLIRRFGATLRHQQSGYRANAMGAWRVPEERIEEVGRLFASFREVSHCYRRNPLPPWPYNLYTMIHADDEEACRRTAERMAEAGGVSDYLLLFSREELKKTSMAYFADDEED